MKKISNLLIFLVLLTGAACNKDSNDAPSFNYTVNNVQDVTVERGGNFPLSLQITSANTIQEPITLAVSGLPSGVTAMFSTISGTPSFTTVLTFSADLSATAGDYPLKITSTNSKGAKREYSLKLHVTNPVNCATALVGDYTGIDTCSGSAVTATVSVPAGTPNRISLQSSNLPAWSGTVDCNTKMIVMDPFNGGGLSFTAKGTFVDNKITLDYSASGFGMSYDCRLILNK